MKNLFVQLRLLVERYILLVIESNAVVSDSYCRIIGTVYRRNFASSLDYSNLLLSAFSYTILIGTAVARNTMGSSILMIR